MNPARLRLLAYGALYFFWGTTFLGIRVAVQHGFPPFILSGLRHGSAGLILYGLARGRGVALPKRGEMLGAMAMGVCFLALANGTCAVRGGRFQSTQASCATIETYAPLSNTLTGVGFRCCADSCP